jgi:hypothetical protein
MIKLSEMIYGVTIDRLDDFKATIAAFDKLPKPSIAGFVCDKGEPYSTYAGPLSLLGPSVILPVDSSDTASYSLSDYHYRYLDYVLPAAVNGDHTFEVNEINGDWCGPLSAQKAGMAVKTILYSGHEALATLYLEGQDTASLYRWLDANSISALLPSCQYIGLSYYPRESTDAPLTNFDSVFKELGDRFPNASLMFSELGAEGLTEPTDAEIKSIIRTYCSLQVNHPRFIGGYFWWDFVTQMAEGPYLPDLIAAFSRQ